jgi:hypothetical protein
MHADSGMTLLDKARGLGKQRNKWLVHHGAIIEVILSHSSHLDLRAILSLVLVF